MSINEENVHEKPEIELFLDSNLNFTISVFSWGLPKIIICKKNESLQNIFFLISTILY